MSRIPAHVIEGRTPPFPEGLFFGSLKEAKDEWYPSDASNPDNKDGYRITATFNNISPADEKSPQVGARTLTQRLDVIYAKQSVVDIEEFNDSVPFQLRQSAGLITQLAIAVGAVNVDENGNADFEMGQFLEALTSGLYNGQTFVLEVEQRTYTAKRGPRAGKETTVSNLTKIMGSHETAGQVPAAAATAAAN